MALGVIVAVFLAGLRHGFDIDHIAAITDITSSQSNRRRSFWLATTYAAGHALVVVALGSAAVLVGQSIPSGLDSFMRRLIGATLVALGVYVIYSALRFGRAFKVRSRWMLAIAGVRTALRWLRRDEEESIEIEHTHAHLPGHHLHSHALRDDGGLRVKTVTHVHPHRHLVPMPPDPFTEYGTKTSFGIGMLHGVGAETPTQILLFATAAGMAGHLGGTVLLGAFVLGLFVGNTILAIVSTMGSITGRRTPIAHAFMAGVTASLSLYVGTLYLLGRDDLLPGPFGG
ncbi:MAG: hypothetical protein ACR2KQ_02460 [Actinomycetota bacterium]